MWNRNNPLPSSCQLIFFGIAASVMVCPDRLAYESPPFLENVECKDAPEADPSGYPIRLSNMYSRRGPEVSLPSSTV